MLVHYSTMHHDALTKVLLVLSCCQLLSGSEASNRPCERLPSDLVDDDFKKLHLVDLYNQPDAMFNSKVANACNLEYVDVKYMQVEVNVFPIYLYPLYFFFSAPHSFLPSFLPSFTFRPERLRSICGLDILATVYLMTCSKQQLKGLLVTI